MSRSALVVLLLISMFLCVVFGVLAWRLYQDLLRQRREKSERIHAHRDQLIFSVLALAETTNRGELDLSEAAIRIKVLLDHLVHDDQERKQYQAIYDLHDATAHFARLEHRQRLSREEKAAEDEQRLSLEQQHSERVMANIRTILEHRFEHLSK